MSNNDFDPPPLIRELFKMLPRPGNTFNTGARVKFLRACSAAFDIVYESSASGDCIDVNSRHRQP